MVLLGLLWIISPQVSHSTMQKTDFPKRIVSLGPINTENIYLLGAGDQLVGNTSYCNRPEAAKRIPKIGSVMQVSVEKIISLRPNIILATGLTRPGQVKKLQELDLKVVQFDQPRSFKEICDQFILLGQLLGLERRAKQIVNQARAEVNAIEKKVAPLARQKVFLQVGSRPLFGSISNSFTHDFITMAGGINIIEDQTTGTTNYEKVIALNPDVIIIAIMGTESDVAAQERKNWQHISVLQAMQKERIHVIDPGLVCSPSPITFAKTLQIMVRLIHPEIIVEEQP